MAPKNSATKQDDERKSRPSEPPINGGKCPTLYHRWDIKFAGTIIESLQCNNQLYPLKDCPICPEMFESEPTSSENQTFHLTVKQTRVSTFQIGVGNRSDVPVWLDSVLVFDADGKLVKILVKKPVLLGAALEKGISKDIVTVEEMVLTVGRTYRVILKGKSGDDNSQEHCKLIIEQYRLTEDESKVNSKRTEFNLTKLRPFIISPLVSAMYTNHSKIDDSSMQKDLLELIETSKQEFSPSNYGQQIDLLNQIELHHLLQEFGKYTLQKPVIQATESPLHYNISIEQFAVRPSLLSEDVRVQFVKEEKSKNVFGYISKITAEMIVILVEKRVDIDDVTRVVFHVDRSTFQLEQTAVVLMKEPLVEQICFPTAVTGGPVEAIDSFEWFRPGITSNKEQMVAVMSIVNQTSFPAPYILFGPPGTGKTSTLVEAIAQVYKLRPTANILVTATSNFAANELTCRLLQVIPSSSIFRYFSRTSGKKIDEINWDIVEFSNLAGSSTGNICHEDIYGSRVVVTTLTMTGRLVQAQINPKHFSYIFIDECGSAKEITSLIPIAGLATHNQEINASIVLAGDPKQLGPVLQYELLKQTVHSQSMLERLMNLPLYAQDPETNEYNGKVVSQLRQSFRSHAKLLEFCNQQFYNGMLQAKAPYDIQERAVGWWRLPNRKCPIILHPVDGQTEQDKHNFSLFNRKECWKVMFYVGDMLNKGINGRSVTQSDIGIVSPYVQQVRYLKNCCKSRDWTDIEIGSVEQFQGKEKAIMLISTVRSRCKNVGFLADAARLNVMLTRARSLMIVIGNPETLRLDPLWEKFIEFCRQNGAIARPHDRKPKLNGKETNSDSEVTASTGESLASMNSLMAAIPDD
ncbi:putative helicase MOV-10 [Aedes albopictus]|uniref:RNA helicase n=1 Tax=Aedes albopictus TaxID=7160 RepID=A0ABM1XW11_AEDAL|nr:putative helicase MOV-10 [Aedes albopictus]